MIRVIRVIRSQLYDWNLGFETSYWKLETQRVLDFYAPC